MPHERPAPLIDADNRPFWEGCRAHELRFQKCRACGLVRWPPSLLCPACYAPESDWIKATGRGRVYTFTVFHHVYDEAWRAAVPYVTAVVVLEEGPRLLTRITGCAPEQVNCEMPVTVTWEDSAAGFSLPLFRSA